VTETIDPGSESFSRRFRPREFQNVCVLALTEDFNSSDSGELSLLNAGVESMVRAGIGGFVFDLTRFSWAADREQGLRHLVRCMVAVIKSGARLNWLHGARFVQEWKRSGLLGIPPDNFETEGEAVEAIQTALKAARIRTDLAQRIVDSGVSMRDIANLTGLFESVVRRIAEGRDAPSDSVTLLISSTLDSLSIPKSSTMPEGAA